MDAAGTGGNFANPISSPLRKQGVSSSACAPVARARPNAAPWMAGQVPAKRKGFARDGAGPAAGSGAGGAPAFAGMTVGFRRRGFAACAAPTGRG
jgi:hypothetical protein